MMEGIQYSMPKPGIGAPVRWYVHGSPGDTPQIGFVLKSGASAVVVQLPSGVVRETVRHIGDPRLKLNEHQRENGAWDFTEDAYAMREVKGRLGDIEARLSEIEAVLLAAGFMKKEAEPKKHWKTLAKEAKEAEKEVEKAVAGV